MHSNSNDPTAVLIHYSQKSVPPSSTKPFPRVTWRDILTVDLCLTDLREGWLVKLHTDTRPATNSGLDKECASAKFTKISYRVVFVLICPETM